MTQKIVINRCFGGFGLSEKAVLKYAEYKGITLYVHKDYLSPSYTLVPWEEYRKTANEDLKKPVTPGRFSKSNSLYFNPYNIPRDDPLLVKVVEELGSEANDWASKLAIVEIPDGVQWIIADYDGLETVEETHRTWS